jgi:hypothetical protein
VPKHFLENHAADGKSWLLKSTKGPYGIFLTGTTLDAPLIKLLETTDDINR